MTVQIDERPLQALLVFVEGCVVVIVVFSCKQLQAEACCSQRSGAKTAAHRKGAGRRVVMFGVFAQRSQALAVAKAASCGSSIITRVLVHRYEHSRRVALRTWLLRRLHVL